MPAALTVAARRAHRHKKSTLSLQDCLDIASAMRGAFAPAEFEAVAGGFGGAAGQAPSWLAAEEMRRRAAYIAHLELSITKVSRAEGDPCWKACWSKQLVKARRRACSGWSRRGCGAERRGRAARRTDWTTFWSRKRTPRCR